MRAIWTGAVSFGLVNIPIKLYSATEDSGLDLDMLDRRDQARIRYKRVNENTGEEVAWEEIVKGYKMGDDYIVLTDEDFEQAHVQKSKTIDIDEFVPREQIVELLYKKPYYLEPQKGGEKAYTLLRQALEQSQKVGVATFVMRQKENLALIDTYEQAIVLHAIRFVDEIRNPAELNLPDAKADDKELDIALKLIDNFTTDFNLEQYNNVYNEALLQIIEQKSKGKKPRVRKLEVPTTEPQDLMEKLRASLEMRRAS